MSTNHDKTATKSLGYSPNRKRTREEDIEAKIFMEGFITDVGEITRGEWNTFMATSDFCTIGWIDGKDITPWHINVPVIDGVVPKFDDEVRFYGTLGFTPHGMDLNYEPVYYLPHSLTHPSEAAGGIDDSSTALRDEPQGPFRPDRASVSRGYTSGSGTWMEVVPAMHQCIIPSVPDDVDVGSTWQCSACREWYEVEYEYDDKTPDYRVLRHV